MYPCCHVVYWWHYWMLLSLASACDAFTRILLGVGFFCATHQHFPLPCECNLQVTTANLVNRSGRLLQTFGFVLLHGRWNTLKLWQLWRMGWDSMNLWLPKTAALWLFSASLLSCLFMTCWFVNVGHHRLVFFWLLLVLDFVFIIFIWELQFFCE